MVYSRSLTHGLCTTLQHLKADGLSLFLLSTALSQAVLAVLSGFSFANGSQVSGHARSVPFAYSALTLDMLSGFAFPNGSLLAPSRILERICIPRDVCRAGDSVLLPHF